ncbi:hypothetical protein D9613_006206 [Agrocybe pediades]|uniref:MYND-type domain-containing protein n=1 Tax=Agrocybe pediades TaxID=84607 RepID=A0A8H4VNK2_9AGAR|nr:hypothetical protein D9613_006206 [Agrocybe pediades]
MSTPGADGGRAMSLPIAEMKDMKCAYQFCSTTSKDAQLRLCAGCKEAVYCSPQCQKLDWKKCHKPTCSKTQILNLESYHAILAYISHLCHEHPAVPTHFALEEYVGYIDSPPDEEGEVPPIVLHGRPLPEESVSLREWWKTAPSDRDRIRLCQRLKYDGHVLPIVLATCIALAAELYATDVSPSSSPNDRHLRLAIANSPVTDFGIVMGIVNVGAENRLAFHNLLTEEWSLNQDSSDHYWIYFKTLAGDDFFLDSGMFPFNLTCMVNVAPYKFPMMTEVDEIPAFFFTTSTNETAPTVLDGGVWIEDTRFSILRESTLEPLFRLTCEGGLSDKEAMTALYSFMDKISLHDCTESERNLLKVFVNIARKTIRSNALGKHYLQFPERPDLIFWAPSEFLDDPEIEHKTVKRVKVLARKINKGEITQWEAQDMLAAWQKKQKAKKK